MRAAPPIEPPGRPIFLLTIDTEEEWDWGGPFPTPPFATRNIDELPGFQRFCADLEVRPTYFVDQAVIDDPRHVRRLGEFLGRGECDIGAHLHPWCTPPVEERVDERTSHAVNLPLDLFGRKLDTLTENLVAAFGQHPCSYRAGRWGVNGDHLRVLAEAGYRVDSSVRPFYADSAFDYARAPTTPYWPSFRNAVASDDEQTRILEVPVSSGFDRPAFETLEKLHARLSTPPLNSLRAIGILWRLRLLRKITLTPEGHDGEDLCRLVDAILARGDRTINLFFHSSDLLPGCTPYVHDERDRRRFMAALRRCIEHCRDAHDAEFLTMREIRTRLTGTA